MIWWLFVDFNDDMDGQMDDMDKKDEEPINANLPIR